MYKLCVVRSVVSAYIRARNEPLRSLKLMVSENTSRRREEWEGKSQVVHC